MPRRFGRYALFDFIGKGGMAEIFLARATTELGAARLCVVKQIVPEYAKHPAWEACREEEGCRRRRHRAAWWFRRER